MISWHIDRNTAIAICGGSEERLDLLFDSGDPVMLTTGAEFYPLDVPGMKRRKKHQYFIISGYATDDDTVFATMRAIEGRKTNLLPKK